MPRIMCSIVNCHYWVQGNICDASEIFVTSDQLAEQKPDSYDAPQAATSPPTPASSCMDTACKTFVEKGSSLVDVDGPHRNTY